MRTPLANKAYYDEFAAWYERKRDHGYHKLVDDLEVEVIERYGRGAAVLEVGCGTGLVLDRVQRFAGEAWGADLSAGMLARAHARKLRVLQAHVTNLPFPDQRFDVVYSVKVLAHIELEQMATALKELARVTRRGGYLVLEFYNPLSIRYLIKALKPASPISSTTTDEAVYTRYDGLRRIRSFLPADCRIVTMRGIRIATPLSHIYRIRALDALFRRVERLLADKPGFRRLGGFLLIVAQRS